jgi:hypothetical protein
VVASLSKTTGLGLLNIAHAAGAEMPNFWWRVGMQLCNARKTDRLKPQWGIIAELEVISANGVVEVFEALIGHKSTCCPNW